MLLIYVLIIIFLIVIISFSFYRHIKLMSSRTIGVDKKESKKKKVKK
ncbi:hypothetical protein SAMN05192562_102198 [Kosakonia arachidis]|uniref:Uncharacterized protein n=1 Tax=Kosakonia arachidis TaxID=551989 RepID=A0A1I7B0K6_9ENTR|nr:hypothetical protein SAMN05192562_102198 [Kosakonia arachidis]